MQTAIPNRIQRKLSVNVNKIATLRNSRGGNLPNVVEFSRKVLDLGVDGITVHPRPDGRHIRAQDVRDLSRLLREFNSSQEVHREFNVEGYPDESYFKLVEEVRPDQCTLVPDPPEALTSNAGWKILPHADFLKACVQRLQKSRIRVSLFIDVFDWNSADLQVLKNIGAERVELYTEAYAKEAATLPQFVHVAEEIADGGLAINAGHDLNSVNLPLFSQSVRDLSEVSIGHAFVSDCLYWGVEKTTQTYLKALRV